MLKKMARQIVGNALQLYTEFIGRQTDRQTLLLSSLNYHGSIAVTFLSFPV